MAAWKHKQLLKILVNSKGGNNVIRYIKAQKCSRTSKGKRMQDPEGKVASALQTEKVVEKGKKPLRWGGGVSPPPPAQSLHHTTCIIPIYRDQYNPFIVPNLVIIISIITNKLDFLHMTACSWCWYIGMFQPLPWLSPAVIKESRCGMSPAAVSRCLWVGYGKNSCLARVGKRVGTTPPPSLPLWS